MGERVPADTVRVRGAIVNAAREASELRAKVPVFKDLLKPDLRDRVGVACCKRFAELLDGHDKGRPRFTGASSATSGRTSLVGSISTAAFMGQGRPLARCARRSEWTRSRRSATRDRRRSRSCIRGKQQRGPDYSYPC